MKRAVDALRGKSPFVKASMVAIVGIATLSGGVAVGILGLLAGGGEGGVGSMVGAGNANHGARWEALEEGGARLVWARRGLAERIEALAPAP